MNFVVSDFLSEWMFNIPKHSKRSNYYRTFSRINCYYLERNRVGIKSDESGSQKMLSLGKNKEIVSRYITQMPNRDTFTFCINNKNIVCVIFLYTYFVYFFFFCFVFFYIPDMLKLCICFCLLPFYPGIGVIRSRFA